MIEFLRKLFHRHNWEVIDQEYIDNGKYHIIYRCSKCGKMKDENIDTL